MVKHPAKMFSNFKAGYICFDIINLFSNFCLDYKEKGY